MYNKLSILHEQKRAHTHTIQPLVGIVWLSFNNNKLGPFMCMLNEVWQQSRYNTLAIHCCLAFAFYFTFLAAHRPIVTQRYKSGGMRTHAQKINSFISSAINQRDARLLFALSTCVFFPLQMIDIIIMGGCSIIKLLIVGNRKINVHCVWCSASVHTHTQHINVDPFFSDVISFH